jgi:hypothetical protein
VTAVFESYNPVVTQGSKDGSPGIGARCLLKGGFASIIKEKITSKPIKKYL